METRWRLANGPDAAGAGGGVKWILNHQTDRRPAAATGSQRRHGATARTVHRISDGPAGGVSRESGQLVDAAITAGATQQA